MYNLLPKYEKFNDSKRNVTNVRVQYSCFYKGEDESRVNNIRTTQEKMQTFSYFVGNRKLNINIMMKITLHV